MSNPALSQLATVEDNLSQQARSLESQLAAIREQQAGLRTVIEMFQQGSQTNGLTLKIAAKQAQSNKKDSPSAKKTLTKQRGRPPSGSAAKASGRKAAIAKTTKAKTTKAKTTKANAGSSITSKAARKKQKDGRAADWQKYVQPGYEEAALPEAVSTVLRSHPSDIFAIADIMASIFVEDMPRDDFLKARNRISNILSAGARDGTWYRGRNGRYAQTENVTKGR